MLYQNYSSFMAPQTEIPLTGEMSRSDKRVTARYEQLEPVTLNMLSATAVASLYRNAKTIHRIVLSATDNSRVPLLQYGVAGERTVQRCRQKQKRPLYERSFCLAPQTRARTCDTAVNRHSKKVSEALCIKGFTHCADDI